MDLHAITRDTIDEHLCREASIDLLAGRAPATRLVVFDGDGAVLGARGRPRRDRAGAPGQASSVHATLTTLAATVFRAASRTARRSPALVAEMLVADGHRLHVVPQFADRVGGTPAVTVVP